MTYLFRRKIFIKLMKKIVKINSRPGDFQSGKLLTFSSFISTNLLRFDEMKMEFNKTTEIYREEIM